MLDLHRTPRVHLDERQHAHERRRFRFYRAGLVLARYDGDHTGWTAHDLAQMRSGIMLGFDIATDISGTDVASTYDVLDRYYRRYQRQLREQARAVQFNLLGRG
jgi:hypothetical protein